MKLYKLLIVFILLSITICPSELKERSDEIIKSVFGTEAEAKFVKWDIPADKKKRIEAEAGQRFFKDFIYAYIISEGDSMKGVAFIDNVYGKSMPITFITLFNSTGEIIKTEILKYREQYGGGVSDPSWNKQFEGKDSKSSYRVGSEIQAITGATISVHSVSKGVNKLALLFPVFKGSL